MSDGLTIIFNPVAKGDKARTFRKRLNEIAREATLAATSCAGDARRLAAEAVRRGSRTIIAAGGDGTLNEVLNGVADVDPGLPGIVLGVLPLGTVNVFAKEIGMPTNLSQAWKCLLEGSTRQIDLPYARHEQDGIIVTRYFVQLAGAGFDARAIELTSWDLKKRIGPLAYVAAGLQCMVSARTAMIAEFNGERVGGELILVGNGRFYGGRYPVFHEADLQDGMLEVVVIRKVNWLSLARCGPLLLLRRPLPAGVARSFKAKSLKVSCPAPASYQLDGELAGKLPVEFGICSSKLRVICPAGA